MCLGIPGKVVETYREHDVLMGKVDFSGLKLKVIVSLVAISAVASLALPAPSSALSNGELLTK